MELERSKARACWDLRLETSTRTSTLVPIAFKNGLEEGDDTRLLKWIRREKRHPITCFYSPFCFTLLMTMVLESKREDSWRWWKTSNFIRNRIPPADAKRSKAEIESRSRRKRTMIHSFYRFIDNKTLQLEDCFKVVSVNASTPELEEISKFIQTFQTKKVNSYFREIIGRTSSLPQFTCILSYKNTESAS